MNTDTVNLLPHSAAERIGRAKRWSGACQTALALTLVAAGAAAATEAGRLEALEARDASERQAESALARDEHRRRLEAEVMSLGTTAVALRRSQGELPLESMLGAITEALPPEHRLERVHLVDSGQGLQGEIVACGRPNAATNGSASAISRFTTALAAMKPFERVAAADPDAAKPDLATPLAYLIRFQLPSDRVFSVVQGDADVNAGEGGHDE